MIINVTLVGNQASPEYKQIKKTLEDLKLEYSEIRIKEQPKKIKAPQVLINNKFFAEGEISAADFSKEFDKLLRPETGI